MSASRYGQPTRARDVLRYLALVDLSGDPSPTMVHCVASFRERVRRNGAEWRPTPRNTYVPPLTVDNLTYGHYCNAVGGWHEGGPGDRLRKAIALAELGS